MKPVRLDKWLWLVRVFKTRALATQACRAGHALVNDQAAKPAHPLKPGDRIQIRTAEAVRHLVVLDHPPQRIGAPRVTDFLSEPRPPIPLRPQNTQQASPAPRRPRGMGRPTKRDRRVMDQWFGESH